MTPHPHLFARPRTALALAATLALAAALGPAFAAAPADPKIEARYRSERAACLNGSSQQDRQTCLREADASRAAALKGGLPTASPQVLNDNAGQRCQAQPAGPARKDCERIAAGEGRVSGSVAAGGELRELKTVVPASAPASAPASSAAPAASAPRPSPMP